AHLVAGALSPDSPAESAAVAGTSPARRPARSRCGGMRRPPPTRREGEAAEFPACSRAARPIRDPVPAPATPANRWCASCVVPTITRRQVEQPSEPTERLRPRRLVGGEPHERVSAFLPFVLELSRRVGQR